MLVLEKFGEFAAETAFVGRTSEGVEGDAEKTEGGDIGVVESGRGAIVDAGDIGRFDEVDDGAAGEGELFEPVGCAKDFLELGETSATTAEKDFIWEHFSKLKLFEGDLNTREPDGEIALDGKRHFVAEVGGNLGRVMGGKLVLFGGIKIDIQGFSDLMREAATADAEHLRSLDAAIVDYGDIGRAATDIHNDAREITVEIVAKTGTADRKGLDGNGKEVKREFGADFLDGGDMNERSKGGIELEDNVSAFEADRVADFIAVDSDGNNSGVDEADFDVRVVGFVGDFFASLLTGALLDTLDDEGHFLLGEGLVATLATIANGRGVAFDKLAGDTNYGEFAGGASHTLGLTQGFLTDTGDARDVGDGASIHIAGILVGFADTDDVEAMLLGLASDDGFDKFSTNIEGEDGVVGGFQRYIRVVVARRRFYNGLVIRTVIISRLDGFSGGLNFRFG